MPLTMRNKKKCSIPIQIHQEAPAKNVPFTRSKRRSDGSPAKNPSKKRAFGDITNAFVSKKDALAKKIPISKVGSKKTTSNNSKKAEVKSSKPAIVIKATEPEVKPEVQHNEEVEQDSLELIMLSCSEPSSQSSSQTSSRSSTTSSEVEFMNEKSRQLNEAEIQDAVTSVSIVEPMEEEVSTFVDIDQENKEDPNQSPVYAQDIFTYLREKEESSRIKCYFQMQTEVTRHMRAVLVDWMVEVQENFELNHETLYLAVKLVDMFLMKEKVSRDILQLLGATGLFIACKYDECCPPALDDFIYICDDAYDRQQFIDMEMNVLRVVDFNLGIPLSYRFLRRYAKVCSKHFPNGMPTKDHPYPVLHVGYKSHSCHTSMQALTLARFILEMSLMHSQFMEIKDSLLASATLMLAFKMMKTGSWDSTLEHYSGYKEADLHYCMKQLNIMLNAEHNKQLATIRNKYSHKVFYEVATIQPLESLDL